MTFPRFTPILRFGAAALGLVLVAMAVVMAVWGADLHAVWHAPLWAVAGLAAAVLANLYLTALIFWMTTRCFDAAPPVKMVRMWHLICGSTLLNYVPLVRAGLVGRTAYLMVRHSLPLRQIVIIGVIVSATFIVAAGSAALIVLELKDRPWSQAAAAAAGLLAVSAATGPLARLVLRRPMKYAWLWFPVRALDVLAVAARLWFAFIILGQRVTFGQAVVMGSVDMAVSILPLTPNGLGLSEWLVGATYHAMTALQSPVGQAAKLLDRSVSILILVPQGLWSLHIVRKLARWRLGRDVAGIIG
jgi:uncharacterized membrane protein YbhN (UPF0104 family)